MRVLIACESSGVVRRAFRERGHDAYSCDIEPSDDHSPFHFQCDIRAAMYDEKWDLMIAHPPCTYLANSGVSWLYPRVKGLHWMDPKIEEESLRVKQRWQNFHEAVDFFQMFQESDIPKVCIENPVPHGFAVECIGKPDQYIQPWEFGEDASKKTGLWLRGLPELRPTKILKKERYANQTPSGQNKLGPSKDRAKLRSVTYQGIADAMAEQWGNLDDKV